MKLLTKMTAALLCCSGLASAQTPQTVQQSWADYDPRSEPLETEVIRETIEDGIVLRQIRYVVGTFGGKLTRVAAFYAFPDQAEQLPGIVQLHGGGQRAQAGNRTILGCHTVTQPSRSTGANYVIGEQDDPNTDWAGIPAGFLDPKHHNDVMPADGTIHDVPHPWNSSWLLYSAAARRAITFLEQQPEADGANVGITGHSMGGRLTVLTAIDRRVESSFAIGRRQRLSLRRHRRRARVGAAAQGRPGTLHPHAGLQRVLASDRVSADVSGRDQRFQFTDGKSAAGVSIASGTQRCDVLHSAHEPSFHRRQLRRARAVGSRRT